jgi:hypothetical protein
MANFSDSKKYPTSTYPVHAKEASDLFSRIEPTLTPKKLISRYLKGINLTFKDDSTLETEDLKDRINMAMNEFEELTGLLISPTIIKQKFPYDRNLYRSYIHCKTEKSPIVSLFKFSITSADQNDIFNLPLEWIETARFAHGQINVIPLLTNYTAQGYAASGSAGIALLSILENSFHFVPAFWDVEYSTGLCTKDGKVPSVVNQIVGMIAAIDILGEKAADDADTSVSISRDGISQSRSGPGAAKYAARIEQLEEKKKELIKKLKGRFSRKYFVGNF